ncbi:MAG: T9SS type A sorting domain-containing protein [Bacteroidota bacterium]
MSKLKVSIALLMITLSAAVSGQTPTLDWVKFLEGDGSILIVDFGIDDSGNVYTTGYFLGSCDFSLGSSTNIIESENTQSFILKQSENGDVIWVKFLHNLTVDSHNSVSKISISTDESIILTGSYTDEVDFDPDSGSEIMESELFGSKFILKLNLEGEFIWVKEYDCFGINSIQIDQNGDYIVAGSASFQTDFDPGAGEFIVDAGQVGSGYVAKFNSDWNLIWVSNFFGDQNSIKRATVNSENEIIALGCFKGIVDFDPGLSEYELESMTDGPFGSQSSQDLFLLKLNQNGGFINAVSLGSYDDDVPDALAIDSNDDIYFAFNFIDEIDIDPSTEELNLSPLDDQIDAAIVKWNQNFELQWYKQVTGFGSERIERLVLNENDDLIAVGNTFGGPLPFYILPDNTEYNTTIALRDGLLLGISSSGNLQWVESLASESSVNLDLAAIDETGIYLPFRYMGSIDFAPGNSVFINSTEPGDFDGVILKLSNNYISSLSELNSENSEVIIFPNPTIGIFNVVLPQLEGQINVNVYDQMGKLITSERKNTSFFQIEINEAPGLYFIELRDEDALHESRKVLVH